MSNALMKTTYTTKKQLKAQDIVLPSDYSKVFEKNAKQNGVNFEKKDVILNELNYEENKINAIVKETNKNLIQLGSSAQTAQTAIINKDTKTLNDIEQDMIKMQGQIAFLQTELFTDTLTKAKNRRWFNDFYLIDNKCPNHGCLAFIDLNDFKIINDNYGHILGDQVLRYLADYLKKSLPFEWANVVRYAGDEFMIIFDKAFPDTKSLEEKMDKIQKDLSTKTLKSKQVEKIQFSFSYGLAMFNKDDNFDNIIELADERMYENKKKVKGL
ncbi:MAG: GGDEF domain-containing protein [Arcobacteraceae bacterium]|nr:GGDEF domain-containing protein [Arcobacteraceae bacterium]